MPASLAFFATTGPKRLVGHDDGDALHAVGEIGVHGGDGQVGVELDVLDQELVAELLGLGLGAGDLRDEPGMVAHLVDVAELDLLGVGDAGEERQGRDGPEQNSAWCSLPGWCGQSW